MPFPKYIAKRHIPTVVELLRCYLKLKEEPKPVIRLKPEDRKRLLAAPVVPRRWRRVLHWIPSCDVFVQKTNLVEW